MEGTDVVEETLSNHCNSSELPFKRSRSRRSLGYESGKEIDDAESNENGDYIFIDILINSNSTLKRNKVFPLERVSTPLSFKNTYDEPDSPKPTPTLDPGVTKKRVKIPNMRVRMATLVVLESITIVFFTIDFILRMFSCPCLLRYFTCFINISDAVALIASYVNGIIILHNAHEQYENDWFKVLEYIQIIRALRLFRIASRVKAGRVLWYTMRANIHDLFILVLFIACGMCTFASILYLSEGREIVESIPVGWYWAVVTMTTVGYGDITPQTPVGRLIACICSVSGLLLFALTVPLFANHFIKLYSYVYTPIYKKNTNASENVIEIIDSDTHRKNETI
ncbi:KCNA2-like protein [Mya arenaria]|uniref:KCNA2-like protein n=2 Tax=Mya arenaria TaxID=6604 RepID=A0ABY7F201_MYAAR|nr:KCNA2-like protein [Mya arenaria]